MIKESLSSLAGPLFEKSVNKNAHKSLSSTWELNLSSSVELTELKIERRTDVKAGHSNNLWPNKWFFSTQWCSLKTISQSRWSFDSVDREYCDRILLLTPSPETVGFLLNLSSHCWSYETLLSCSWRSLKVLPLKGTVRRDGLNAFLFSATKHSEPFTDRLWAGERKPWTLRQASQSVCPA